MKKGQTVEVYIDEVRFPNRGIGRAVAVLQDGVRTPLSGEDAVLVKNTIPGQRVLCRINKNRNGRAEGQLLEVIERSACEGEVSCPAFGICGGCIFLPMAYEDQLKMKEKQVLDVLSPVVDAPEGWFEGIVGSPLIREYRNKMEFTFGDEYKDGPLALGMHKRGSFYDIVNADECELIHPDYRRVVRTVLEFFSAKNVPYFHRVRHEGYLRYLLVRRGVHTGEMLIDLVTASMEDQNAEKELLGGFTNALLDMAKGEDFEGTIAGILHTRNDSLSDAVKDEGTMILFGRDHFFEELMGLKFKISPFSFFQTNTAGAQVLYDRARSYALKALSGMDGKASVIFDLYSGTGTIAQLMSPAADRVIGVEIVEEAVLAARDNAAKNGLHNCEFFAGDVLKVVPRLKEQGLSPDLIILDPPRDGCHPKALPSILDFGAPYIVYISCKVTSLARDLSLLQERGYRVVSAVAVDQFPQVGSIETVCLLSKLSEAKHHIEVKVDMDELDLTSAEAKATYREIEEWVREKYGFHVTNLNIAQVKQKHGIIERVNYNKPKSSDSKQPGCPEEKVKAIEDAMRHFQMIE